MKDNINYYYNLNIDSVEEWDNYYTFEFQKNTFYFVPFKRPTNELDEIISVCHELKMNNINCHDLILNKFGQYLTNIYNTNYILLKPIPDIYEQYEINDILKFNNRLTLTANKTKLYRNMWAELWSAKVDYFEYQISETGKDKKIIINSFSYYIGLAENAISYVNNTNLKYQMTNDDKICLSHRRLSYPNYKLNYLNPLSFIFDIEVRDIAEYLKSAFFSNEPALNYLKETLKLKRFTIYSLELLFARLIYPSYYFDLYEKIMNDLLEEEKLIPIIDKANDYEFFLKEVYEEINKYAPITRIDWLMTNK